MTDALTPQQRIESDVKTSMKARDSERTQTLRMLLTSIKNRKIELGNEIGEDDFLTLVKRAVKQRKEAAEQFRNGDRIELAEKEERELVVLEAYLPEQVDEATLRAAVEEFVAAEGLSGMQAMGKVMPAMMAKFGGGADGKLLSQIVREVLAG